MPVAKGEDFPDFELFSRFSLNKIQEPSQKGKKLSKKNELVIIYKGSGKLYYKTVSKLEQLDNLAMQ